MNKYLFLIVGFLMSYSTWASTWYYRCEGAVIWPHCERTSNGLNCPQKVFFTDDESLKKASALTYGYFFNYRGKTDVVNGKRIDLSGTCKKWSNHSNECAYAVDTEGKDLVCSKSNLGKYIATN